MKNKKIVLVIPDLKGNGAERVVLTLASGFKTYGYEVHIVVFNKLIELEMEDIFPIHIFNKYYRWIPKVIRGMLLGYFLDVFIKNRCGVPSLVLSNLLPADMLTAYSQFNSYFIIHSHMSQEIISFHRDKKFLSTIYTKKPAVCVSKGVKKDFDDLFDSPFHSHQIYNPIDTEFIKKMALKFTPDIPEYIVHVGKFNKAKRHDILIKAYSESGVNIPLVLIGQGPLFEECQNLVKELVLEGRVIFVGFQSNPYPYIKYATFMVLSSDFEGLPTVILESLALGTPIISTDCPSGPSEMLPQKNLCEVGNINELGDLIQQADTMPQMYNSDLKDDFLLNNTIRKYLSLV